MTKSSSWGKLMDGNNKRNNEGELQMGLMKMECASRGLCGTNGEGGGGTGSEGNTTLFPNILEAVATSWNVYSSKVTTLTRFLQIQSYTYMNVCFLCVKVNQALGSA